MSILRWLFLACTPLFYTYTSLGSVGQQADEATIRRYSQQAQAALAKQDAGAAVVALEELARLTPNNPEVFANLGVAYYTQRSLRPSRKHLPTGTPSRPSHTQRLSPAGNVRRRTRPLEGGSPDPRACLSAPAQQ